MQGNSLITSYEGIDFDEIVANQPESKQLGLFSSASEKITDKISLKQQEFIKTPYTTRKGELKQEIENLIVELVKTKFEEKAEKEGHSKSFYEETIRNFAQNKENRNFFPWKLFFADVFENGGFDVVIECCGNSPAVGTSLMTVEPGGTVVLVGVSLGTVTIPTIVGVMKELTLKGAIGYTKEEFQTCIDLLASKKIDVLKFVDDIVGLDEVQKSYKRLTSGTDDAVKILVDPNK